jgi:hypothetical protein
MILGSRIRAQPPYTVPLTRAYTKRTEDLAVPADGHAAEAARSP